MKRWSLLDKLSRCSWLGGCGGLRGVGMSLHSAGAGADPQKESSCLFWPAQEDEQLRKLVQINGAQKWSVVAEKIKVRVGCAVGRSPQPAACC